MDPISQIVRQRRTLLGFSLAQLAEAVGCSKAYLSAVENDKLDNPPRRPVLERLERALGITDGQLIRLAEWRRTPASVRAQVQQVAADWRSMAAWLKRASHTPVAERPGRDLDALYRSGQLRRRIEQSAANVQAMPGLGICYQVPLINRVAAGYPTEFTDLDYPARVADEYLSCPDLSDPQAFSARVVGSSMEPTYHEGDIIVFSPAKPARTGADCFVRLLPDHHTTFKRVHFQIGPSLDAPALDDDHEPTHVRLQPLNPAFQPQVLPIDQVAGLYPAVMRMQKIG
ncbi:MAG: LexA family transcriptional regulator [Phycisphaeraceae bacterium]